MTVVVGAVADALGHASQWVTVDHHGPGRNFDVEKRFLATPSIEYRYVQKPHIRVDRDHDRPIGEVKYLDRTDTRLIAVCEIDGSGLDEGPWYYSPQILHRNGRDIELLAVAITKSPASVALRPLTAYPGTLKQAAGKIVYQDGRAGELVKQAYEYDRRRGSSDPIVIQGTKPQPAGVDARRAHTTHGQIEIRSATTVDIRPTLRELDMVIAPAESPSTNVVHNGRQIVEVFSHGAFRGAEHDPGRIRVNMHHRLEDVIGKATSLDPWDEQGLTGTVRLSRTRAADEALSLAADELLGVSAGFAVPTRGDEWKGNVRRIRKAALHHIALTSIPAYERAEITAVRARHR